MAVVGVFGKPAVYRKGFRLIDPIADAVPGQSNAFYIDRGSTTHGYNVVLDGDGVPDIEVVIRGRQGMWTPAADIDHPTKPGDFSVIRSQSTGPEGPAALGSTNAVLLAAPISGAVWVNYRRKSQAGP